MRIPERLSLRLNVSWTLAGNLVYGLTQWAALALLAKLGTPTMVGQFVLALAITAPLVLLGSLQLRALQATDAEEAYAAADYLTLRVVMMGAVLAGLVVFAVLHGYETTTLLVLLLVGCAKAVEAISDILYGRMQFHERMDAVARSMIWKGSVALLGWVVGLLAGGLLWACVGLLAARVLTLAAVDRPRLLRLEPDLTLRLRWRPAVLKRLAWLALPLGLVAATGSLVTTMPRYMLERFIGLEALGIFGALAYILVAGHMVMSAVAQSASPRIARLLEEGGPDAAGGLLLRLVVLAGALGTVAVIGAWVAGSPLLRLLYAPEYAEHHHLLVWIMVAGAFSYMATVFGVANTAIRCLAPQLPLEIGVLLITAATCVWLIPIHGMYGAAGALVAAGVTRLVGAWALYTRAARWYEPGAVA